MKQVRVIKGLQSQLEKMKGDAEALKVDLASKQKEYHNKLNSIEDLKKKITKLSSNKTLKVTEHAILRYCERVLKLDVKQVEREILTKEVIDMIKNLGSSGTYPNNNFKVVVKDNTVVTII